MKSYEDYINAPVERQLHTETPKEYKARKANYCKKIASKYTSDVIVSSCIEVWEDYTQFRIYALIEGDVECYLPLSSPIEVIQASHSIYPDRVLVISNETHQIVAAYAPLY
jgi:hypothetical protein